MELSSPYHGWRFPVPTPDLNGAFQSLPWMEVSSPHPRWRPSVPTIVIDGAFQSTMDGGFQSLRHGWRFPVPTLDGEFHSPPYKEVSSPDHIRRSPLPTVYGESPVCTIQGDTLVSTKDGEDLHSQSLMGRLCSRQHKHWGSILQHRLNSYFRSCVLNLQLKVPRLFDAIHGIKNYAIMASIIVTYNHVYWLKFFC